MGCIINMRIYHNQYVIAGGGTLRHAMCLPTSVVVCHQGYTLESETTYC